jgi:hypothetical protein
MKKRKSSLKTDDQTSRKKKVERNDGKLSFNENALASYDVGKNVSIAQNAVTSAYIPPSVTLSTRDKAAQLNLSYDCMTCYGCEVAELALISVRSASFLMICLSKHSIYVGWISHGKSKSWCS